MQEIKIDRELAIYMKGIAIILMVVHHAFANPDWHILTISYPALLPYARDIGRFGGFAVVPMFVFLTGYTYYLHQDKSIKYSLKKISIFFVDFWLVLFLMLGLAYGFADYRPNALQILQEMFSVTKNVMLFSWYILLYIEIMFFLPCLHRWVSKYSLPKVGLLLLVFYSLLLGLREGLQLAGLGETILMEMVDYDFLGYGHLAILGYFIAKYDGFTKLNIYLGKDKYFYPICLLAFLAYQYGAKYNVLCTSLWILGLYKLDLDYSRPVKKILLFLGRHSMNIWFFQCLFFAAATREFFQPLGFAPSIPPLVVAWILFLCTVASLIFTPVQKLVQPKVEALFK